MRTTLLAITLLAACGDDTVMTDLGGDLSSPDLEVGPDLSMDPPTVNCGGAQCDQNMGQVCCVTTGSSKCSLANACSGNPFACDGPEDCMAGAGCCGVISGVLGNKDAGTMTMGSGGAACMATCSASATLDTMNNFTAHSKLCHQKSDCAGLMGSTPFGTAVFDGCCSSAMTGDYKFCAPTNYAGFLSLTCS
jgi:hypothetical protein